MRLFDLPQFLRFGSMARELNAFIISSISTRGTASNRSETWANDPNAKIVTLETGEKYFRGFV